MTVETDFAKHKPAVANIVPPQKAGRIAELAGVADRTGWCPVDPLSFESTLHPDIHIIGDACVAGAMPKAGFAANAQAKVCAAAMVRLMGGQKPDEPRLINTCYTIVAPEYGITVAAVYHPVNGQLVEIQGSAGTSPVDAPKSTREQEAKFADGWFKTITGEIFG
jgi:NADPH-dependent 2,4-dienoyl-CoA reductase/sulfur reductase-like enzyme